MSYWDIFLVGKGLDVSGVATLAFLGMAGGEEESWEEKESVSREGEELAERSLEDQEWEKGEREGTEGCLKTQSVSSRDSCEAVTGSRSGSVVSIPLGEGSERSSRLLDIRTCMLLALAMWWGGRGGTRSPRALDCRE